ncbi:MAG: transposase [Methylobacterium sp.]|jgi:putative transposase|nr:transposase [Methylobacterium sp.]MCA3639808.1 transposase [Methylobacterium sp.]MCA3643450.1 transposase [Methylobacterium sp.]MCA3647553.1 transposase [Methylobacterium sp.]MCA3653082.1 transposase [Methylobacterium sp.]
MPERLRSNCAKRVFTTLAEARAAIQSWKEDYNQHRPHSALGNRTPAEFAAQISLETRAA